MYAMKNYSNKKAFKKVVSNFCPILPKLGQKWLIKAQRLGTGIFSLLSNGSEIFFIFWKQQTQRFDHFMQAIYTIYTLILVYLSHCGDTLHHMNDVKGRLEFCFPTKVIHTIFVLAIDLTGWPFQNRKRVGMPAEESTFQHSVNNDTDTQSL